VFLEILRRFNTSDRPASDRKGSNYAPTQFAEEKEAKAAKLGSLQIRAAMLRLLDDGRIRPRDQRQGWQRVHTLAPA